MRYFFAILFICNFLNAEAKSFQKINPAYRELRLSELPRQTYKAAQDEMIIEDDGLVEVEAGRKTFFYRHLTTAVCESRECYPVEIMLYWDLAGNYLGFEVPGDKSLTKLDHKPFTDKEYDKLDAVLKDPYSQLKYYNYHDLVSNIAGTDSSGVDGTTGATLKEISTFVVKGAVYSFHRLWHLVNGNIINQVRQIAEKNLSNDDLLQILNENKPATRIFVANVLLKRKNNSPGLYNFLFGLIQGDDDALAQYAISSLPSVYLNEGVGEAKLIGLFGNVNASRQVDILNKLSQVGSLKSSTVLKLLDQFSMLPD